MKNLKNMKIALLLLLLSAIAGIISLVLYFRNKSKNAKSSNTDTPEIPVITSSGGGIGSGGGTVSNITAQNQTLQAAAIGSINNAIALSAITTNNCAENPNRTIVAIGGGITLKKNGNVVNVNDTFTASDVLTYDVANTVVVATAKQIISYKANGVCGDSNVAILSANIISTGSNLFPFQFKDAYLSGSNYLPYASLVDAEDKNFDESGFTNRTATLYTTAMDTNNIAYADAAGTQLYPAGNYFYDANFEYLSINAQGVMFLFGGADKAGAVPVVINTGY